MNDVKKLQTEQDLVVKKKAVKKTFQTDLQRIYVRTYVHAK